VTTLVDPAISRAIVESEMERSAPIAATFGWLVERDPGGLIVRVGMRSAVDEQEYLLEAGCDNYKAWPPYLEFIEPGTLARGSARAYPRGGNGYFHSLPCICAPFSRKAYQTWGGPHGDWSPGDWVRLAPAFSTLGEIFHLVQRLINDTRLYQGRMG